MIVLGIDPGSKHVGWAVLDVAATVRHIEGGCFEIDAAQPGTGRLLVQTFRVLCRRRLPDLVGVERIDKVNARGGLGWAQMATGLVLSHGIGQRVAQALEDDGRRVEELTAETWHEHFFGVRAPDGHSVKALVHHRVAGWPPRSNGHARDAAAVALYVARTA